MTDLKKIAAEMREYHGLSSKIDKWADRLDALAAQSREPVAWSDHVEQRIRTWRQSFVNTSGDQLAIDDFMDSHSLDDLIDFVCDVYAAPQRITVSRDALVAAYAELFNNDDSSALRALGIEVME